MNKKNGIITSPLTFLATANAAKMCNAPVFFSDVDSKTGLITPKNLEDAFKRVNFKVGAVTIVHLGGHLCDLEGLSAVAKKYNSYIIEDACHAIGAIYYGKNKSYIGSCKYSFSLYFQLSCNKKYHYGRRWSYNNE